MNTQETDGYQPPDKDTKPSTGSHLMRLGKQELNKSSTKRFKTI